MVNLISRPFLSYRMRIHFAYFPHSFMAFFAINLLLIWPIISTHIDNDLIATFPSNEQNVDIVRTAVIHKNFGSPQSVSQNQPHHQKQHHAHHGKQHSWGYDDQNGPSNWGEHCRHGRRQSPIDIRTSMLEFAYINEMHFVNYELSGSVELKNNGHGVELRYNTALSQSPEWCYIGSSIFWNRTMEVVISGFDKWGPRERPYIYGGGLSGKYLLAQFHFHWAADHEDGSEHTVNALHYPVELHLVHVKNGYTLAEALHHLDGLALVGIFYHIGMDGSSMTNLESGLKQVVEKDAATLIFNYTVGVHLPPTTENFYRYQGSLTTPGCNEAVIWTIMAEPMPILSQQLELLRAIHGTFYGKRLGNNVRPVQPLNGRRVQFRSSSLNRHKICTNETFSVKSSGNGAIGIEMIIIPMAILFPLFCLATFKPINIFI